MLPAYYLFYIYVFCPEFAGGLSSQTYPLEVIMSFSQDSTAAEFAAIAYAVPPLVPEGIAPAIEVIVYLFSILTTIVIILRIWVRAFWLDSESGRGMWGVDDSLAVLGFVSSSPLSFTTLFSSGIKYFTHRLERLMVGLARC